MLNVYLCDCMVLVVFVVCEGMLFYQLLDDMGVFDDLVIDLVKVGEVIGVFDEMFVNVFDFFDEEVEM